MNLTPGKVGLDTTYHDIGNRFLEDQSNVMDQWRHFYLKAIDPFPHIMTKHLGKTAYNICNTDANNAGNI